jgi:ABC-type spermidine/putrescine transport system permease subunit II
MVGLVILNIYPMIKTVYQSFCKTGDFGRGNIFIGTANYAKVFSDPVVWQATLNTFKYMIVEVPFSVIIALFFAVLLNKNIMGKSIYRTIFFLPMVAAPAAIAMVWRWLFNSQFGLINNVFHISTHWISDPSIAVYSIALIGIWSDIGYNMILFLAGLQEVPREYYEASSIDGTNGFQKFHYITVPMISPTIFFRLSHKDYRGDAGIRFDLHDYGSFEPRAQQDPITGVSFLPVFIRPEEFWVWIDDCRPAFDVHHGDYGFPNVRPEKMGPLQLRGRQHDTTETNNFTDHPYRSYCCNR